MMEYTGRLCLFTDHDAMDVAQDYFRMYAAYLRATNPDERSVPMFQQFMRAWDRGDLAMFMLYLGRTPVGFLTAYRIRATVLGQQDIFTIGACYTMPEHRSAYKMTILMGKQFAELLKATGVPTVTLGLPTARATRLQRLARVAVTDYSRGFAL